MNKQEIEQELNKMQDRIAELKQELNKTEEGWIPKNGERYWYYSSDLSCIFDEFWKNKPSETIRLKNKVIFKTEEEAQRYVDYQKVKQEYSYEFSKKEWEDSHIKKCYIQYDYEDKIIRITDAFVCRHIGMIYFKTQQQAQEFIDKYQAEILEYEFGIKE